MNGQDASQAEIFYLQAGQSGHFVVPGATPESWLDSGSARIVLSQVLLSSQGFISML